MATETNVERLEIIKATISRMREGEQKHNPSYSEDESLMEFYNDFDWLIQQSERVQELEASNNRCVQVALSRQRYIDKIDSENARLREALEFYAFRQAYYQTGVHPSEIMKDYGETARTALNTQEDSK